MNRLHDMEPRVMDDEMLKLAVGEQGPREEAGQLAKQEGILFKDVLSLQLDFQSACPGWARAAPSSMHSPQSMVLGHIQAIWVERHKTSMCSFRLDTE